MNVSADDASSVATGHAGQLRLGPGDWIDAARKALIEGGIAKVKLEPLAAALGVTTGSFYWHFKDREALLAALLDDWAHANTKGMISAARKQGASADERFVAVIDMWVRERGFSPAYDSAVRDWARISKKIQAAVIRVDRERIALLREIFLDLGYDDDVAEVRARIMYFHQVGYYTLNVRENRATRARLRPYYIDLLRGNGGQTKQ